MGLGCESIPWRAWVALMLSLGALSNNFLGLNINMAIIPMTDNDTTLCSSENERPYNPATNYDIFCWSDTEKSLVKGIFYYGYLFLQIPGGRLSERFGTKLVFGLCTLSSTILTFLMPLAAKWNVWALIVARGLMGLAQGAIYPSMYPMALRWSVEKEITTFTALATMGGTLGLIIIYPIIGLILEQWGWKASFYFSGLVGTLWCLLWLFTITDDPITHPLISEKEKQYILKNRTPSQQDHNRKWPLLAMITSRGVLVMVVICMTKDFGIFFLITEGPNYLTNVLGKDITTVGFLSSLPYIGRFTFGILSAPLTDFLLSKPHLISRLNVRRLVTIFALAGPAAGLVGMAFFTEQWIWVTFFMVLGFTINGFVTAMVNTIMDIAPTFSGTVMGIANGIGSIMGFFVPLIASAFTAQDPADPVGWKMMFFTAAGVYVVGIVTFVVFGTVERQSFDKEKVVVEDGKPEEMKNIFSEE